jgi:hypothetical protein
MQAALDHALPGATPAQAPEAAPLLACALAALRDLVDERAAARGPPCVRLLEDAWSRCGGSRWTAAYRSALACPAPEDAALVALAHDLRLGDCELLAAVLAAAVEIDTAVANALAWLQAPIGHARPTLGMLAAACAPLAGGEETAVLDALLGGRGFREGVIALAEGDTPLAQREVRMPRTALALAIGSDAIDPLRVAEAALDGARDALTRGQAAHLARAARALDDLCPALAIRGSDAQESAAAASAIADALGLRAIALREPAWPDALAWWCVRMRRLAVVRISPGPGDSVAIAPPPAPGARLVVLAGPDGAITMNGVPLPEVRLAIPDAQERAQAWRRAGWDAEASRMLGERYRCGLGRIATLSRTARFLAACDAASHPEAVHVGRAAAQIDASVLHDAGVAAASADHAPAPIVTPRVRADLDRVLARCRVRERLAGALGRDARCSVKALLAGPSGTGKTMAARWIAGALGLPLMAVDLAALTSKWIGETEKNLARLFARAEDACAVLLFDEADSVFGTRTDMHTSNDRFANNQTNYLLQRIESWDGIVLLTTNARQRIDPAFVRRLDAIVDFPAPDVTERAALWRMHLGTRHALPEELINRIAVACDLAGGHVAGACATAHALALDGQRLLGWDDALAALRAEYAKLGMPAPALSAAAGLGRVR